MWHKTSQQTSLGYILAHDLGTTGNKATLYTPEGELVASCFYPYETHYLSANWVEQNPEDWWKAVCLSTAKLLADSKIGLEAIKVVSFSGQMMGALPVDKKGTPLRPAIIWADQRGIKQAELLKDKVGMERVYKITGHRASPSYSAAKIMWIRDEEPELFKKAHKFLQAKDYIAFKLTGRFVTDYSDASGTNLLDLRKKEWSEEILKAVNLPEGVLPELHASIDVIGEVTPEAAAECGLKVGTPVVIGGGDGSCAAAGAGVVGEGSAYNYLGSSSWVALATREPIYDPKLRTFNWVHLDPRLYSPCGTMQSAGGSLQWAKEELCSSEREAAESLGLDPYELINLEIAQSPEGAKNLLFLPYLLGERSPHWNPNARGVFLGLTRNHTKKDMLRAILEGVCFNLRIIIEAFEEQGASIEAIRIIGGGAKGWIWRKIMADIYGKPILLTAFPLEATSLGAAIAGGIGVGFFKDFSVADRLVKIVARQEPEVEKVTRYAELFQIFKEAYERLLFIFEQLSALSDKPS
ncbi:MAG: xylulokinase [Candidatus Bipolaricaulia bacterium]